jgi:hypothetical protein
MRGSQDEDRATLSCRATTIETLLNPPTPHG